MWLGKSKNKYIVYSDDGYVLISTRYKNIENKKIKSRKDKSGKVTIEFSNVEQFDVIYKLLTKKI